MLRELIEKWQRRRRRRVYSPGAELTRFVACDIRRDVRVVDASEVDDGFITASCRTWNVLYDAKGIEPEPEFSEPSRIEIKSLWNWKGPRWGGPVPKEGKQKA